MQLETFGSNYGAFYSGKVHIHTVLLILDVCYPASDSREPCTCTIHGFHLEKNTTKESMQSCAYFTAMIELVIEALSGS